MDPDTIQKIAAELAKHLPNDWWASHWWVVLLLQAVVTVAAAAGGAFYGEYFRTWGKNLATRDDFDLLTAQLQANTQLVETIKSEVSQKDWAKREWTNVRKIKLEELFENIHDSESYLNQLRHRAIEGTVHEEIGAIFRAETIVALYFPELKTEFDAFYEAHYAVQIAALQLLGEVIRAGSDQITRGNVYSNYSQQYHKVQPRLSAAVAKLEAAGRTLLMEIMGVAE
jgi:hypothetical protein